MKNNSNLSICNLVFSIVFLISGLILNPFIIPVLFSNKVGTSLDGLSFVLVSLFDVAVLGLSFFFFKIRSTPLSCFLRTNWRELLTLGVSIIGCFFFAEWILRFWATQYTSDEIKTEILTYNDLEAEQRRLGPCLYLNHGLNPEYKPNSTKEHNSLGYRGKEFLQEKPDCVFRIVCLGGSTTYTGKVPDWQNSYPAQLESSLRQEYGYNNIEVINAGVPAYSSWETLINFAFRVLELNPDLIIIYHAVNDLTARIVIPEAYKGDNTAWRKNWDIPRIPLWQKSMILRLLNHRYAFFEFSNAELSTAIESPAYSFYKRNTQKDAEVLKKNPPVYFERNLRSIIAIAKDRHIQIMLSTFAYTKNESPNEHFHVGIAEHNQIIQTLAQRYSLPLIDFKTIMPEDAQYWVDTVHLNEFGTRFKANAFADFLHKNRLIPTQTGETNEQTVDH